MHNVLHYRAKLQIHTKETDFKYMSGHFYHTLTYSISFCKYEQELPLQRTVTVSLK